MSNDQESTDALRQELRTGETIHVDAHGWGLTWAVRDDGQLAQVGLGPNGHTAQVEVPLAFYPLAYRTWGSADPFREAALRVTHADGTLTTRLRAQALTRTALPDGEHLKIECRDELFDFNVEHNFRTHHDSGIIEQWVEIEHGESGPVLLHDYDSACQLLLAAPEAELIQFGGSGWADEWRWTTEGLHPGIRTLSSLGGVQPHLQRAPMLMLCPDGPSHEDSGTTIGMSIAWGGNTRFRVDVRPKPEPGSPSEVVLTAGANPYGAEYLLEPGQRFVTPTVAWIWSDGRSAMTDAFHSWTRARVLRDPEQSRAIVANNWEATFFDFDEDRIKGLIKQSAELDAEVFLLDDGWFGSEHPRNDDEQGLGDWEINTNKLPNGLDSLAETAEQAGIRFGIWVEPEMVNQRSRLYDDHPDWVVRDGHDPALHRNQLYLDPLLSEVTDFESNVIDQTLASAPSTSYVKWDANRPITDPGSGALPRDRQSNLFVDGVHRTWDVMRRVAEAHPSVDLMLCASGGGRSDHGTLRYFHEFWTSDNTDPVTRIRMQWACLHFFPASAVAAHVTRWGERPLGFACAVALSARFGIDLDLTSLTDGESDVLRASVEMAKRTRDLVQFGKLTRLISPTDGTDGSRAALAFIRDSDAVVFRYQIDSPTSDSAPLPQMDCFDPGLSYRVHRTELNDTVRSRDEGLHGGGGVADMVQSWPLTEALSADILEIRADGPLLRN
ncbi:MAG: alpha-galactosidase [Microthrixaceae bacterium]|nr:alpha-galactosidase [Microthrixaceae bacterium]